jgi:hypothetical protein
MALIGYSDGARRGEEVTRMDENAFASLLAAVEGKGDLGQAWSLCFTAAQGAPPEERTALLAKLDPVIAKAPEPALGAVALLAGALVEIGAAPAAFPPSLFTRIGAFLDDAPASIRTPAEDEGDEDDVEDPDLPEPYYQCERAAAAVLSRSVDLRRTLPQKAWLLGKIRRYAERYGFLGKMLQVLDDEPFLIVHPGMRRAWRARVGGIADNYQLHLLLRAALAGDGPAQIAGARPSPEAIAAASDGDVDEASAQSDWQLANWRAVLPDGGLTGQDDTTHWIWNEGFPAEVDRFEGTRLIAVGPSTIQRSWNAPRIFDGMHGWLRVEGVVAPAEVEALLGRMRAALAATC